jgi:hypothetical protein
MIISSSDLVLKSDQPFEPGWSLNELGEEYIGAWEKGHAVIQQNIFAGRWIYTTKPILAFLLIRQFVGRICQVCVFVR